MAPRIRRARREDWERLRDLRLLALRTDPLAFGSRFADELAFPPSRWIERADHGANSSNASTWVAEPPRGELLGLVVVSRIEATDHLFSMWVAPEVRGEGIGGCLLDRAVGWARGAHGNPPIFLDVNPKQTAAVRLYRSRGFRPTGRQRPLGDHHPPEEVAQEMVLDPAT